MVKAKKEKLLSDLNTAQQSAVSYGVGPLLIIAGAGTGKTTVITRRIAQLIESGVKPEEILALTFTEKAATEMEQRVDILLPYGYHDLWIHTFHGFCQRVLQQHALDIGISNDFKMLEEVGQWLLVRQNLDQFELEYYRTLGNPTKFIKALLKHFSKLKDEEISPEEYLEFAKNTKLDKSNPEYDTEEEIVRLNEVARAYHIYQRLLLTNDSLDFGDLINYALKLFRTRPKILNFYRSKFKYILVDEFQDTNYAQYELIKLLAEPKNNLTVVGDDDQSIYKFRGASVSNIMRFKKDFPKAQEITLTENYRSTQEILDTAYNFIQLNNPERLEPKLKINKKLVSAKKEKGEIAVLSGQTLSDEVDLVVKKILELKKQKETTWNDFAILVRSNDTAEPFIAKFASLNFAYTFVANKGLYKKPIIVDLIAYLRLLVNFHDTNALFRVMNMEQFRFDHRDMVEILQHAQKKTLSLYESLEQVALLPTLKNDSITKINQLIAFLKKQADETKTKSIAEVFVNGIYGLKLDERIEKGEGEPGEADFINQFYKKIEAFEVENTDKTVRNFLAFIEFEQEAGDEGKLDFDPNQGPESIKIMTIHSAKGLEFKNVFVVNMVDQRFPSRDRKEAIEIPKELVKEILPEGDIHLQEERRLFYVAMTRAKQNLYFSYASDYGGQRARKPSQFLIDIGLVAKPEKSVEILKRTKFEEKKLPKKLSFELPTSFNYTAINEFKKCPLGYKYKYLLHLPTKGSKHLSFGNTIHTTFERFLKQYKANLEEKQLDLFGSEKEKSKLPAFEALQKMYESYWIDEWYPTKKDKEEYRERGRRMLRSFYDSFEKLKFVPKYIEERFVLKLGEYTFTGKIDRADLLPDGKLQIIDYKTGEKFKDDKENRYQLYIYQWAAEEYFKHGVSKLNYWFLKDNELSEDIIASKEELEHMKEYLLGTIDEIHSAIKADSFKQLHEKVREHRCDFADLE
ncbi:MAG: ATP-dependent DNA helicase [Patescibacteria group bacterium]